MTTIALPRLAQLAWQLSPNANGVTVELHVRDQASLTEIEPDTRSEEFEVSPRVLEAMLEGFSKIKDQLSQI